MSTKKTEDSKITMKELKKNVGRTIEIIECSLGSPIGDNLTPGSTHVVIDAPKGHKLSEEGVWVQGAGDQAMLLNEEFKFVTEVVEPKKLTLKEKRALKAAEKAAAESDGVVPTEEVETKKAPTKKKDESKKVSTKKTPAKKKSAATKEDQEETIEVGEPKAVEREIITEEESAVDEPEVDEPEASVAPTKKKDTEITHKVCRISGEKLSIESFGKDKATKDGYSSVCKAEEKKYRSPEAKAERARLKEEKLSK